MGNILAFGGRKAAKFFIYEKNIFKIGLRPIDYSPTTYKINPIDNPNTRLNVFISIESLTE